MSRSDRISMLLCPAAGRFGKAWFALVSASWLAALLIGVLSAGRGADLNGAAAWTPRRGPLMTRWASEVNPTNALSEYPRPQLVRSNWMNLNGLWEYALRPLGEAEPTGYDGTLLVPFPIESALSGVMKPCEERSAIWYRRNVNLPAEWKGSHIRLLCGGVDWECNLTVNGRPIGQHRGGYSRFAFDITPALRWDGAEKFVIQAVDPTEGEHPRGKQTRVPEGIFYSCSSGIWQTLWLEPVPEICIDDLKLTPDVDAGGLRIQVAVNSLAEDLLIEAVARAGGKEVARLTNSPNIGFFLPIPKPELWSPEHPFLYDLQITLRDRDRVLDRVGSYFGMRKVSLAADDQGINRIALNNKPVFQVGVLDQGFWPDGIYTAPTDEALKSDITFLKQAGFNLARKHVKVEPDRWYYWCDRMGLLVWQDMPSGKNVTPAGRRAFEVELLQVLRELHNHPSIVMWVLFNEGWGQYDTERLARWLQNVDPSRLVNDASGWTDRHVGDIVDLHSYPGPDAPEPEAHRAAVLGEFGGLGLRIPGHSWSTNSWGYKVMPDSAALAQAYATLLERVWTLHDRRGLSAAVYTQISDVETECNGLLTYDRRVAKLDAAFIMAANHTPRRLPLARPVISDASQQPTLWKYTFQQPPPEWVKPGFDAAGWKLGSSGFGTASTPGARVATAWESSDIWLRRNFVLWNEEFGALKLQVHHDEDAEIYINGLLAASLPGYTTTYEIFDISPPAEATLTSGTNTLAVHCHQTAGGQYIDVGLVAVQPARGEPASAAKPK